MAAAPETRVIDHGVRTVLFDLGGVLTSDPWESFLLTPRHGLADRLGLDHEAVRAAGNTLWRKYCTRRHATAKEYWSDLSLALKVDISDDLSTELQSTLLTPHPDAPAILTTLRDSHLRLGLLSDNTAFWFPMQRTLLNLDRYVDRNLVFLSYLYGVRKNLSNNGLILIAASHVDPASTVVVEDREHNISHATNCGFLTVPFSLKMKLNDLLSSVRDLGGTLLGR